MTVSDLIEKRRRRWRELEDIEYDRRLVAAAVRLMLSDAGMRSEVVEKPYLLIELCFDIVDKRQCSVPFFFNDVQRDFIEQLEKHGTHKPYIILKGRQQGFTSLITAIQLSFAIVRRNFSGFTLADCSANTQSIFNDKARMPYSRLPGELKPREKFNSAKELFFDKLNSSWRTATATKYAGRSKTLNFVHLSEAAFYSCTLAELQASIAPAMTEDTFCVYESTANGFNEFYELWESGSCVNLFYGWWRTAEYRSTHYEALETDDKWLADRIEVLRRMGLDREQITWYCERYAEYVDKSLIRQEYPCSSEEAFVASGECIFNKDTIQNRIIECGRAKTPRIGNFEYTRTRIPIKDSEGRVVDTRTVISDVHFEESLDGCIRLHEDPIVKRDGYGNITARAPYVIGGDTAGTGEDFFAAKVICNLDGHTVATLHRKQMDEDIYAEQLYCLGRYYHNALIGVEINYSRQPMRILAEYEYPNLYLREKIDKMTDKPEMVYGFETTPKTRPVIVAELVKLMRDQPELECDVPTLKEMTVFVKKSNGRQEAQSGAHDDLVISLAIAHFISSQQTAQYIPEKDENDGFVARNFNVEDKGTDEIWEDY